MTHAALEINIYIITVQLLTRNTINIFNYVEILEALRAQSTSAITTTQTTVDQQSCESTALPLVTPVTTSINIAIPLPSLKQGMLVFYIYVA